MKGPRILRLHLTVLQSGAPVEGNGKKETTG